MKYITFLIISGSFLYSHAVLASQWCANNIIDGWSLQIPSSDTNRNKIKIVVNSRNNQENRVQKKNIFSNKIFWISFLDFGWNKYSMFQWKLEFWDWQVGWFLDGGPCFYPQRQYEITRETKKTFDQLIAFHEDNARYNLYADKDSPSLPTGTFFWGTEIYETWSIDDIKFIITYSIWEFDGSSNYQLWIIWNKYNYRISSPHNSSYDDVKIWKTILKTIKF